MTAYLIVYGKDPSDRFAAYQYPTRTAAREASLKLVPNSTDADHGNGGGCAYVIERPEDITLSGTVLVAVYNALTNANLKKFETRQVGVERLLKHLPEFAQKAAPPINEEKSVDTNTETKTTGKRGRKGRFEGEMTITVLADKNPKREGTKAHQRFALYRSGMKVSEFIAAGGGVNDLAWDSEHGFIRAA